MTMRPCWDKRFLTSPKHLDWLWGPPSPQPNEYQGSFLGVKWRRHKADHLHLVPRLWSGVILLFHLFAFIIWTRNIFRIYVWSSQNGLSCCLEGKNNCGGRNGARPCSVETVSVFKIFLLIQWRYMNYRHGCVRALTDQNILNCCCLRGSTENIMLGGLTVHQVINNSWYMIPNCKCIIYIPMPTGWNWWVPP